MRTDFPIFQTHPELVYLDSASTAQRCAASLEAERAYYTEMNANVHRGLYDLSESATRAYEAVRTTVAEFLGGVDARGVIFTRGTTEGVNLVAQAYLRPLLKAGDEVLVTALEHHSNFLPWQAVCEAAGATLKMVNLQENGALDMADFEQKLSSKTRLVAVTALSNVLGMSPDFSRIIEMAHQVGAVVLLDLAQWAAHAPCEIPKWDADFAVFSSHKLYGSTGAGVLYGRPEILETMAPWQVGGGMVKTVTLAGSTFQKIPHRFEAGTPAIAQVLGMGAALEFLTKTGWNAIQKHEDVLLQKLLGTLKGLPYVKILGEPERAVVSFEMEGVHPHDVAGILAESQVCVRAGHHCCQPLLQSLRVTATVRASLGIYNTELDVERLVRGLEAVYHRFQ